MRHTPEQIIRKLREAGRLLGVGLQVPEARVLQGRAPLDVRSACVAETTPVSERVRGQLWAVVHAAHELRWRRNDTLEHGDGAVGVDRRSTSIASASWQLLGHDLLQLRVLGRVDRRTGSGQGDLVSCPAAPNALAADG